MDKSKIYTNSKDEWYTPKHIVDMFGTFNLDAASNAYNAVRLGIPHYYSKEDSALEQDWFGRVWCNPPFSLKAEFIKKAREELEKGNCESVTMLLPMSFETKIFHKYILGKARIFIPNKRISFETLEGKSGSPAFGSCIIVLTRHESNQYTTIDIKEQNV